MTAYFLHDQLNSRFHISGRLKVETPLRISSGVAGQDTDAPFVRNIGGNPYIPGTSLRGAVRSQLERVLCGIGADTTGIKACTLFSTTDCAGLLKKEIEAINTEPDEKERRSRMADLITTSVCDLCCLFGNTMFASRITFEDGRFEDAIDNGIIRDGVGIDRDTGAAAATVKYDYEVIDPGNAGLKFSFNVTVENATPTDRKIIHVMLRLLTEGIYIGGKRAGGLGRITLGNEIEVTGFEDAKTAWELLAGGKTAPALTTPERTWKEVFPC